jgi:hypothetical protein
MSQIFALISLICAVIFITIAITKILSAKFNAFYATMLGIGGLSLIDIPKYYYLEVQNSDRPWIGDDSFQLITLLIWLSCFFIFFSYYLFTHVMRFRKIIDSQFNKNRYWLLSLLKFLVIPVSIVYIIFNDGSGYASMIGGLIKGIIVCLFLYGLTQRDRTAIIASIILILIGVDDSSRRAYIAIFIPMIVILSFWYLSKYNKINLRSKIILFFCLLSVFIILNALRSGHDFGEGFNQNSRVENTVHYIKNLKSIDTFYNTAFIVERFPLPWDYYFGETYLSVLVALIPRSIWPDKPVGLGSQLGLMQAFQYRGFDDLLWQKTNMYSLSPGFVGEAYANFGFTGVCIVSFLLGFLIAYFDRKLVVQRFDILAIPWIMLLSCFIVIHRGDFYVSVNYQIFMFFSAILFRKVFYKIHR